NTRLGFPIQRNHASGNPFFIPAQCCPRLFPRVHNRIHGWVEQSRAVERFMELASDQILYQQRLMENVNGASSKPHPTRQTTGVLPAVFMKPTLRTALNYDSRTKLLLLLLLLEAFFAPAAM